MNFHKYIVIALAILLVAPIPARADTITLDFSYSDDNSTPDVTGVATLDATLIAPGAYSATSGSLVVTAPASDGIAGTYQLYSTPPAANPLYSPTGLFVYDEFVLPGSTPSGLNFGMLAFGAPGNLVDFFSYGPGDYALYTSYTVPAGDPESYVPPGGMTVFTLNPDESSVPDGGMTVALLGLSLVGLAGVEILRRRFSV